MRYLCIFLYIINLYNCNLIVKDTENNMSVANIDDRDADFGDDFEEGAMAYIIESHPLLACNNTIDPPPIYLSNSSGIKFVSLIERGICTFEHKVRVAQDSGYGGVIIYNNKDDHIFRMPKSRDSKDDPVKIPSRMIGLSSGYQLKKYTFTLSRQQFIVIFFNDYNGNNPQIYIIAFLGFVSLGFLLIGIGFAVKLCRDCIQRRANRLKKCHLKNIPIKKFVKGEDQFEMCAICLEDFSDGDKLRILPCNHAYHMKCIDPWLLKQKRNCPICKSRIKIPGRIDESDDSSINGTHSEISNVNVDEHTPLINPREGGAGHSYFSNYESEVNFAPERPESSSQNFYQNSFIDSSTVKDVHSLHHHPPQSTSINNDGSDMIVPLTATDTSPNVIITSQSCPTTDLTKMV